MLQELLPSVEALTARHLEATREWFPHELVPWSRGRDFAAGAEATECDESLPDGVRSALLVNLLTEDNLPYYTRTISGFGGDDAWRTWTHRWTAEEGRHSIVIRDYLCVTRAIDLVGLERARMAQVSAAVVPERNDALIGLAYVAVQELATRIAHRNTGQLLDGAGKAVMSRVAADENLHHLFYRDLTTAALEIDPDRTVLAIAGEIQRFAMPGTGIPDFERHARAIAAVGIYDFAVHHDQIVEPLVFRHWRLQDIEGLGPEAEAARDKLFAFVARLGRIAARVREQRAEKQSVPV